MRPASIGPVKHLLRKVNLQELSNILNSEIDSGSSNVRSVVEKYLNSI
jgi:phosphotransferase system enzyme I (PtsP)